MTRMNKGLVHIYTGDGKGKTTAALGLLMRSYGADKRVLLCQFLKGQDTSELKSLEKMGIEVIRTEDVKKFVPFMDEDEKRLCKSSHEICYNKVAKLILGGEYDLVVLDESIPAMNLGLIDVGSIIKLINDKPVHTEIVLTGRDAPKELEDIADYISEINSAKHPFEEGVTARIGIEY